MVNKHFSYDCIVVDFFKFFSKMVGAKNFERLLEFRIPHPLLLMEEELNFI